MCMRTMNSPTELLSRYASHINNDDDDDGDNNPHFSLAITSREIHFTIISTRDVSGQRTAVAQSHPCTHGVIYMGLP